MINAKGAREPADLFGLAATLYFALTGEYWFRQEPDQSLLASIFAGVLHPLHDRRPGLPKDLVHALERALEKDPADRWRNAAAMRKALMPVTGGAA
jgi:serine/threonine-protein kinase